MESSLYHLIVYVPHKEAEVMRKALANAGAGNIGHYDSCSFSLRGTGRFCPNGDANPAIGAAYHLEEVDEERIEVVVAHADLHAVVAAAKKVHSYEEPAIHIVPMLDYKDFL